MKWPEGVGVGAFVVGLVAWHAGGGEAIDCLVTAWPLVLGALLLGAVAGVVARSRQLAEVRRGARVGLVVAVGVGLAAACAGALVNRAADGSERRLEPTRIVELRKPSKGPREVHFTWEGRTIRVRAALAPGCVRGAPGTVRVRRGALRMAWVEQIDCAGGSAPAGHHAAGGS